ncbi:MAG: S8 family serine peptidase [Thermoleophilia bacterium]
MLAAAVSVACLPAAASASVISQGAFRMGADAMWAQGLGGAGQTVAILDEGFGGLTESIAAGELPGRDQMGIQSFDARYGLDGRNRLGGPTQHGTRMAEIVHDVAPGAHLVLVNYNTVAEFTTAVAWITQQGIPIVSHSNSFLDGPFDGTGPAAQAVDRAAAAGAVWVNSAGNFAQRHWEGQAPPGGVTIPIPPQTDGWLDLHLSWRDPAALALITVQQQAPDGTWNDIATSTRSGPVSVAAPQMPMEPGTSYRAVITQTSGSPQELELFSGSAALGAMAVPAGSVATPGDARGAIAVAAVPWAGTDAAVYSSQGPTDDGRLKPDVAGPTYVTANADYPGAAGTSAATAHVAGAAALLRQARLLAGLPVGVDDMRAALGEGAEDLGVPGRTRCSARAGAAGPPGAGRAGARDPRLGLVRIRATDDGTFNTLDVRVGNRLLRHIRRLSTGLRYTPSSRTVSTLVVTATDVSGNATVRTVRVRGRM